MMENNSREIEIIHKLNKDTSTLITVLNSIVENLSTLTNLIYDKEIESLEEEIRLKSHM